MLRRPPDEGQYYQGVMQLRPATEEVLDFLDHEAESNPRFVVSFQRIQKRGEVDLYITDQRVLIAVGRKLSQKFQGVLKISRKLHTRDATGNRNLYRVTVVFRPFPHKRGDTIVYRGERYTLDHVGKNRVALKDPKSGKKTWVELEELL